MTKSYGDGMDNNELITHVVDQLLLIDSQDRPHDRVLDEWIQQETEKAAAAGVEFGTFTERERSAILTRFMDVTL